MFQAGSTDSAEATFAQYAPELRRAGWAVIPAKGKAPLARGFNKMLASPSERAVEQWARRNPDADIVFVAGLSSTGKGRGIIAVDCDDEAAIGHADELFGDTPGKVRTRRGEHRYFDGAGIDLGKIANLRDLGINIDLKHGQGGSAIIVAPPSAHEKDPSFHYAWNGCDPSVIRDLSPFPLKKLKTFLEKNQCDGQARLFNGRQQSRGLWLNDELMRHAPFFDGEGEELLNSVLDKAQQLNESLSERGYVPLKDDEVTRRARQIVQDIEDGKIERRLGRRATCVSDADEIRFLASFPKGENAFMLLQLLRAEHGARCKRGETFAIAAKAMARNRVLGKWCADKFRDARALLLQEGFVREIRPASRQRSAEYILADRALTPSRAQELSGGRQIRSIGEQNVPPPAVSSSGRPCDMGMVQ